MSGNKSGPVGRVVGLRQRWLQVHRWLGIFLLLLSLPIGLTGSINVYHREIDSWLDPKFYTPVTQGSPLPLKQILANLVQQDSAPVVSIILPDAYWPVVLIHQRHGKDVWRTSIDPVSGQILGRRDQTHALLPTLYRLHQELLLKPYWGEEMVGVCGLALCLSALSGLWLWWPKPGRWWRSMSVRLGQSWYRTNWELHGAVGFWLCLILLVVAGSGVVRVFPKASARVLGVGLAISDFEPPRLVRADPLPVPDPDAILRVASQQRPNDVALVVGVPNPKQKSWRVAMRPRWCHGTVGGLTQLWIDPWNYQVIQDKSAATCTAGDIILAYQFPLHNGSLLGEPGRAVVFVSGLAMPLLAWGGFYLWWHKWRLQRRAALARRQRLAVD